MTKYKVFISLFLLLECCIAQAQTFSEVGKVYPLSDDAGKYVISGFTGFSGLNDERIYANAFLWTVENICPKQLDGITDHRVADKRFSFDTSLASPAGSGQKNTYHCNVTLQVADGKLIYYVGHIQIESGSSLFRKVTPMERLTPEKKPAHKEVADDFAKAASQMLNKMFDFVAAHHPTAITHWSDIAIQRPVKGMTEDECRLAFGKPQSVMETGGEVQWMYTSSFYLFFKNGKVSTIIK